MLRIPSRWAAGRAVAPTPCACALGACARRQPKQGITWCDKRRWARAYVTSAARKHAPAGPLLPLCHSCSLALVINRCNVATTQGKVCTLEGRGERRGKCGAPRKSYASAEEGPRHHQRRRQQQQQREQQREQQQQQQREHKQHGVTGPPALQSTIRQLFTTTFQF